MNALGGQAPQANHDWKVVQIFDDQLLVIATSWDNLRQCCTISIFVIRVITSGRYWNTLRSDIWEGNSRSEDKREGIEGGTRNQKVVKLKNGGNSN